MLTTEALVVLTGQPTFSQLGVDHSEEIQLIDSNKYYMMKVEALSGLSSSEQRHTFCPPPPPPPDIILKVASEQRHTEIGKESTV